MYIVMLMVMDVMREIHAYLGVLTWHRVYFAFRLSELSDITEDP